MPNTHTKLCLNEISSNWRSLLIGDKKYRFTQKHYKNWRKKKHTNASNAHIIFQDFCVNTWLLMFPSPPKTHSLERFLRPICRSWTSVGWETFAPSNPNPFLYPSHPKCPSQKTKNPKNLRIFVVFGGFLYSWWFIGGLVEPTHLKNLRKPIKLGIISPNRDEIFKKTFELPPTRICHLKTLVLPWWFYVLLTTLSVWGGWRGVVDFRWL